MNDLRLSAEYRDLVEIRAGHESRIWLFFPGDLSMARCLRQQIIFIDNRLAELEALMEL